MRTATKTAHVAGYVKDTSRGPILTDWHGRTILACRSVTGTSWTVNEFGETGNALAFLLPNRRAIVGLSLGNGMLFRGELVGVENTADAIMQASRVAEYWVDIDARSAEEDDQDEENQDCPACGMTLDRDCNGNDRCPDCDGPCPCCYDGGGPI